MLANFIPLVSGLSIGLFGSFHCIGMCGPLALALPTNHLTYWQRIFAILFYNVGRTITYLLLGLFLGLISLSFSWFKVQQFLSIISGSAILLFLFLDRYLLISKKNNSGKFANKLKWKLANYLSVKNRPVSFFNIGLLNGLLPCGLVYVAVAASVMAGSPLKSSLLMIGFGMGTWPLMAFTMYMGNFITLSMRRKLNTASPYFVGIVALLLIIRGLDLGIPFLSPSLSNGKMSCCH